TTVRVDFPPELERILLKGLARDRAARYQTALEMQLDLQAFARDRGLDVTPLALSKFMATVYPEEAEQTGRPMFDSPRPSPALGALSLDAQRSATPASPPPTPTRTLPATSVRRRIVRVTLAASAVIALGTGAYAMWASDGPDAPSPSTRTP